jgi:uncharacterized pyridoxamine 5'-phosphate oxidase family protein/Pyruvate/2-oxoacid:ferredoxin oxidoreductase delta subunit
MEGKRMNAQNCLNILRKIKDVAFATVNDEGKPEVRIIDVMIVENEKLYFCTGRGKDFYKQLISKPEVAVTGLNREFQMVRLTGRAEKLTDQKFWIDRIFQENPAMNDVYPGESRYILEPFCISCGELEFFDLGKSPIYRESFVFGEEEAEKAVRLKGFRITDACIGCGKCMRGCPQQCIVKGKPFQIQQEHCLHCGLCYENCPVQAIVKRGE